MSTESHHAAADELDDGISRPDLCALAGPAEPEPFRVEVSPERDRVRVTPVGELDLATARPLDDKLHELEDTGWDLLVLDLHRLSFIDCTGLNVLLTALARARQSGNGLTVLHARGQVRRLLELVGQPLDVVPNDRSARRSRSGMR